MQHFRYPYINAVITPVIKVDVTRVEVILETNS